jgi:2'-5' RNA ligase
MSPNWFVAWPVCGAEEWLAGLEAGAPGGLNFLAPPDLHVTLAFLGRYDPVLLGKISALAKRLPAEDITASPKDFVALPQPRRFSALAFTLGVGQGEVDKQIAKWRDRFCREAGARLESRPVLPHVTIARPDRRIGSDDRDAALEWVEQLPPQGEVRFRLARPRVYAWTEPGSSLRYQILDEI